MQEWMYIALLILAGVVITMLVIGWNGDKAQVIRLEGELAVCEENYDKGRERAERYYDDKEKMRHQRNRAERELNELKDLKNWSEIKENQQLVKEAQSMVMEIESLHKTVCIQRQQLTILMTHPTNGVKEFKLEEINGAS